MSGTTLSRGYSSLFPGAASPRTATTKAERGYRLGGCVGAKDSCLSIDELFSGGDSSRALVGTQRLCA